MRTLTLLAFTLLLPSALLVETLRAESKDEQIARDRVLLQGPWKLISSEQDGKPRSEEELKDARYLFVKNQLLELTGDKVDFEMEYALDPTSDPRRINEYFSLKHLEGSGEEVMIRGIYKIEDDKLTICTGAKKRPKTFSSEGATLLVLQREKPAKKAEEPASPSAAAQ